MAPRADLNSFARANSQIPHIDDRLYPAVLAGDLYPDGIQIYPQSQLEALIHAAATASTTPATIRACSLRISA